MTIAQQTARLNELIRAWNSYRNGIAEPQRFCQIKNDLYQVRNAGWNGNPPINVWPVHLVDADDGMNAAVEHYFLCRCWVGTGVQPAWQMRAMNFVYDMGKLAGVTPRHNPNKPVSKPSALQMAAKQAGVRDGEKDLEASGKSGPWISKPPTY
jgi:hypothetical protein